MAKKLRDIVPLKESTYDALHKRYFGGGKELNDKEMETFRDLHQKKTTHDELHKRYFGGGKPLSDKEMEVFRGLHQQFGESTVTESHAVTHEYTHMVQCLLKRNKP